MKTYRTIVSSALVAFTVLAGSQAWADNLSSIAITPATGVVTLTPRWGIGGSLAGFHHMSQDLGLTGSVANNFYSIKSTAIPAGGDTLAFNFYVAGSGSATPHADIGSKLTPNSYSALTSADPDVGYGSVNLYLIHHKGTTDYFAAIIPGSASASAVTDEKPMSGPGGPGTVTGVSGYFGLTFAASNLGYGLNNFYYLRTDPATGSTKFGTLNPALLASSADQFDLGASGHKALVFTGTDVGYGTDKMYYLRLDPVTGFTIFGMLNPALAGVRHTSDIANLGSVYSTLAFVPGDVGFGSGQFYTTGAVNPTWQSVSFAAIADRAISLGSFTVTPSASSTLPIALTLVSGSVGSATISGPVAGVFTVTPTAPGLITLQASQAGQVAPTAYEANMLRQSFTATGSTIAPVITNLLTAAGTVATPFSFNITASGTPSSYTVNVLPAGLTANTVTGVISGTPTQSGVTAVLLSATNAFGTGKTSDLTITILAASVVPPVVVPPVVAPPVVAPPVVTPPVVAPPVVAPPVVTPPVVVPPVVVPPVVTPPVVVLPPPSITSATSTSSTVGTPFVTYLITATGLPTSFSAVGLPAGLSINTLTGAIDGTSTVAGTSFVTIHATNSSGTSTAILTIVTAPQPSSRIVNFSARAISGPGDRTLIVGFVISGNNKNLLVRGIGPALSAFGIANALADPTLTLFDANGVIARNDDWETAMSGQPDGALIAPMTARVGAFALPSGSKDSAVLITANDGAHTTSMLRSNSTTGVALAEIYDTDTVLGARLINVSARMNVTAGEGTLIAGLVIAGNAPKTVLIRAVGPTLSAFGVNGVLADPQISVVSGNTEIASNDNWETGTSTAAQIIAASAQVGAFALPSGSNDAALLITLQPGAYTVVVTGVGNTTGVALVEVYDVL